MGTRVPWPKACLSKARVDKWGWVSPENTSPKPSPCEPQDGTRVIQSRYKYRKGLTFRQNSADHHDPSLCLSLSLSLSVFLSLSLSLPLSQKNILKPHSSVFKILTQVLMEDGAIVALSVETQVPRRPSKAYFRLFFALPIPTQFPFPSPSRTSWLSKPRSLAAFATVMWTWPDHHL